MTRIVIHVGEDFMRLSMEGHACYNLEGKDIVCSAVSILGQALVETMLQMPEVRNVAKMEKGNLYLETHYTVEQREKVKDRMELAINGFRMLQDAYPRNVSFTCQE